MVKLIEQVNSANQTFSSKFDDLASYGIPKEQYIRYLQMQYHLTKGVQETFLSIASHPETRKYRSLRKFLIQFGYEEEMHYKLAEHDLKQLGADIGEIPFAVQLWWSYQKETIKTKPIERLGATAILENIGNFAAPKIKQSFSKTDYLNNKNTTFVNVHMHETLPHGDQILNALEIENFDEKHIQQLIDGAIKGTWLYIDVIFNWVINGTNFQTSKMSV